MPNRAAGVTQRFNLATSRALAPERRAALLAAAARQALDEAIRSGRAAGPHATFVDGVPNVPEDRVRPEGAIL